MLKYFLIPVLFFSVQAFALTNLELFQKINDNYYNLKSFEIDLVYRLYKGHKGTEVMDSYASTFRKEGKLSHRKLHNDEIISGQDVGLVVNHELKTIQVVSNLEDELFDQDIKKSFDYCQDIVIKENGTYKFISVTFKANVGLPYSRLDFFVDENYWVSKMIIYCSTQLNFSKDYFNPQHDVSRLEIDYVSLKKSWKDAKGLTNTEKYVIKEGENYIATPLYKTYELIQ
jgi:hypothetical protein